MQYGACINASTSNSAARGETEPAAVTGVRTHVFDLGDGSYLASYVLTAGGRYSVLALKLLVCEPLSY
jgi:hypothetical protein